MAIKAKVNPANEQTVNPDDTWTETHKVLFFGPELDQPDYSIITVTYGDSDTLAAAETKLVDAVIAEWNAVRGAHGLGGTNLARARVVFPAYKRGS